MYESLRGYRFLVQGFEHSSDKSNENHVVSLKGVALLTGLHHKNSDGSETEIEDDDISVFSKETFFNILYSIIICP